MTAYKAQLKLQNLINNTYSLFNVYGTVETIFQESIKDIESAIQKKYNITKYKIVYVEITILKN